MEVVSVVRVGAEMAVVKDVGGGKTNANDSEERRGRRY